MLEGIGTNLMMEESSVTCVPGFVNYTKGRGDFVLFAKMKIVR
jgi:hypothetical protein